MARKPTTKSDSLIHKVLCLPAKVAKPLQTKTPPKPLQIQLQPSTPPLHEASDITSDSSSETTSPPTNTTSPTAEQTPYAVWASIPHPTAPHPTADPPSQPLPKHHVATQLDPRDANSPDAWIPRSKHLVRLTGKHPFNAEPPITRLFSEGFLTPISLHYVRNHGRTPKLSWNTHRLSITGFVNKPLSFSMDELSRLPTVTLPVTLVCSANRRKELNMLKQTIGFNWGPAATSTSTWTGVKLLDLLVMAGVDMTRAKHVHLLGAGEEALPNGLYGTSIDIATAMDPFGDVIVAWEQNSARLAPDHGFPLRVIVPGWISGRMVKWLDTIEVNDQPSDLYYHYYDNILFPSYVDADKAHTEGWWFRREYHMNQIQINSVIVQPHHGDTISTTSSGMLPVKGYAFSGGGRKITRVEISLDDGHTWKLCELDYPEERHSHAPRFGRYYCWMFWECKVNISELRTSLSGPAEIRCRAWDQANNSQPREQSWNLVGMGNNAQFAVKIVQKKINGASVYQFQHPTISGASKEGWMTAPDVSSSTPKPAVAAQPPPTVATGNGNGKKTYAMEEVRAHNSEKSAWIVVDGKVFDCTEYLSDHPGGIASIIMNAGEDSTEDFHAIHSDVATKMLDDYYIGDLEGAESPAGHDAITQVDKDLHPVALDPKKWTDFELIDRVEISSTLRMLTFKLQTPQHRLGLPVGYHMFVKAVVDGKTVMRAFTPVSSDSDYGQFVICMKVYQRGVDRNFPQGGVMSQYIDRLQIGDMLSAKGPVGHFEYNGRGKYTLHGEVKYTKKLGFICGGTGLTPVYQIMQAIEMDEQDDTEVYLIYSNHKVCQILMHEQLRNMVAKRDNIHVLHTLVETPEGWRGEQGHVNEEMVARFIPHADEGCVVGVCGRRDMVDQVCLPNLAKIGYDAQSVVQF